MEGQALNNLLSALQIILTIGGIIGLVYRVEAKAKYFSFNQKDLRDSIKELQAEVSIKFDKLADVITKMALQEQRQDVVDVRIQELSNRVSEIYQEVLKNYATYQRDVKRRSRS